MCIGRAEGGEGQTGFAFAARVALPLLACLSGTTLKAQQAATDPHLIHSRVVYGDLQKVTGPRDSAWRLCQGAAHAEEAPDAANLNQLVQTHRELGFQSELGDTELAHADMSSRITTDSRGVQALIWNEPVSEHSASDKARDATIAAQFRMEHLAQGDYRLELFRTNCGAGEAFTNQSKGSFQPAFDAQRLADLRQATSVAPTLRRTVTIDQRGFFSIEIPVQQNELVLVLLSKEAK
jgi:hypothetical protein